MNAMDLMRLDPPPPEAECGDFAIKYFEVTEQDASLHNLRCAFSPGHGSRGIKPGQYVKLVRNGTIVMSNTPAEMRDHVWPVIEAKGHVLIHGLGLGMVAEACLRKEEVESVTVIEIAPEVHELVGQYLEDRWDDKIEIVIADCLEWQPPKGVRYGMVWHDIWDTICEDNLDQMKTLHRRYGRRCDWQGSWARELCEMNRW